MAYKINMAERKGFEPLIQSYPYTPLAGERLQPLGHLSVTATNKRARQEFQAKIIRKGESITLLLRLRLDREL